MARLGRRGARQVAGQDLARQGEMRLGKAGPEGTEAEVDKVEGGE